MTPLIPPPEYPVVWLKDAVLFPHNELPVFHAPELRKDYQRALTGERRYFVALTSTEDEARAQVPGLVGTLCEISEALGQGKSQGIVMRGMRRVEVCRIGKKHGRIYATVSPQVVAPRRKTSSFLVLAKALRFEVTKYLEMQPDMTGVARQRIEKESDPAILCDLILPYLSLATPEKFALYRTQDDRKRIQECLAFLKRENALGKLSEKIHLRVKGNLHEEERREYLKEQITAIKRELGEVDDDVDVADELEQEIARLELPKVAKKAATEELQRLGMSQPGSAEYLVSYNYLQLVKDLPWNPTNKDIKLRFAQVKKLLDKNHYGLANIKERVLEYLAVIKHKEEMPGQILLLTGPPGVGKTSLARSIAEALGRPFARIALGGMKDEAEIRGHRRTYVGALPGKVISCLKETKTSQCVILLDEIDKIGGEREAAVSSALLEVLDPEQNRGFVDYYLGVPFDLSKVLFIATANDEYKLSGPLRDRMEILRLSSYSDEEKVRIAKSHILPAVRRDLALTLKQFDLPVRTLRWIVKNYTRETGVRQLRMEIARIGRKIVRELVERRKLKAGKLSSAQLVKWLGPPRYLEEQTDRVLPPGMVVGLAYTELGGELLNIETSASRIETKYPVLKLTGSVGKVLGESAQAALSYLAANLSTLGISPDGFMASQIHIHLPDGGTPKDGPSAGVALTTALLSLFTGQPFPATSAMTGEITLIGRVLPVGGIKEKVLAAYRYGKKVVFLPKDNRHDLAEIPAEVRKRLSLVLVSHIREVWEYHQGFLLEPKSKLATLSEGSQLIRLKYPRS
jgi:ATP-dependent Lon protease